MLHQPDDAAPTTEPTGQPAFTRPADPGPHSPGDATSRGLTSAGILLALAILGGLAIVLVRKRTLANDPGDDVDGSLMDNLRDALRDGTMTQEEFNAAKRSLVGKMTARDPARNRKK